MDSSGEDDDDDDDTAANLSSSNEVSLKSYVIQNLLITLDSVTRPRFMEKFKSDFTDPWAFSIPPDVCLF